MIEVFKFEGKSKDDLLTKITTATSCSAEELFFKESESEGKLFKTKKVIVEVVKKTDVIAFIKDYINKTSALMNLDIKSEINEKEEVINVILVSDNNPILIGKDGRTLNSIQLLLRQSLSMQTGMNIKLSVDASNYKAKKLKNLEYDIKRIANEVLDTHVSVKLDSMNSYERRFVHNLIGDYPELSSESDGEGMDRHITIRYKEKE